MNLFKKLIFFSLFLVLSFFLYSSGKPALANTCTSQDAYCALPAGNSTPICYNNTCVQCTQNSQCSNRTDGKTQCNTTSHTCVVPSNPNPATTCHDQGGCAANSTKNVCDISRSTCVECLNNSNCSRNTNGKTACNTSTNACVVPPATCTPTSTCASKGWDCGTFTNSCGKVVACGADQVDGRCVNGKTCNSNHKCVPITAATPTPSSASCTGDHKGWSLSVTPVNNPGQAGATLNYTVTVTNNDNVSACPPSDDFTLSETITNQTTGWSAGFADTTLTNIAKGQSKHTTLHVNSPSSAAAGSTKTIVVAGSGKGHTGRKTQNVTYAVTTTTTPTPRPHATPTPGHATPTPRPHATPTPGHATPTPTTALTPTPPPAGSTTLNIKIGIDGIGSTPRVPGHLDTNGNSVGGNQNPDFDHANRQLTIQFYNATTNSLVYTISNEAFTYKPASKKFELNYVVDPSDNLVTGLYNVYASGLPYLTTQYPGSVTITKGATNNLTSNNFYLITGNINNNDQSENRIDLLDYNVMISCWIYSQDSTACNQDPSYMSNSDLNGDGQVNEDDYTLLLEEISNQQGAILP